MSLPIAKVPVGLPGRPLVIRWCRTPLWPVAPFATVTDAMSTDAALVLTCREAAAAASAAAAAANAAAKAAEAALSAATQIAQRGSSRGSMQCAPHPETQQVQQPETQGGGQLLGAGARAARAVASPCVAVVSNFNSLSGKLTRRSCPFASACTTPCQYHSAWPCSWAATSLSSMLAWRPHASSGHARAGTARPCSLDPSWS